MTTTQLDAETDLKQRIKAQFFTADSERTVDKLYVALTSRGNFGFSSMEAISAACQELLSAGELLASYRVHSPFADKSGLYEYDSLAEIPETLEDDWDYPPVPFQVRPENITVVYRRGPKYAHPVPLERLILDQFRTRKTERSFTRLVEVFGADGLCSTLDKLVSDGRLRVVTRIHSPYNDKEVIWELFDGTAHPESMIDTSLDEPKRFDVRDDDLEVVYFRGPKYAL